MISFHRLIAIDNILEANKDWIDIYTLDNVASVHAAYDMITENLFPDAYELAEYCFDKISTFCKEKQDKSFILKVTAEELQDEVSNIFFKTITFYITKYDRKTIGNAVYHPLLIELKDVSRVRSTWSEDDKVMDNIVISLSYYDGIDLIGNLLHELKHAYKDYKIKLSGAKGIIISKEKIQQAFSRYNRSHENNPLTNKDFHLFYNFVDPEEADAYVSSVIGELKKQKFKSHKDAFDWLYDNSSNWNLCVDLLKRSNNTLKKLEGEKIHEYLAKLVDKNWSKFISKVYAYIDRNNVDMREKAYEAFAMESAEHALKRENRIKRFISI